MTLSHFAFCLLIYRTLQIEILHFFVFAGHFRLNSCLPQALGTRTLGTRAWCLHEMGTRARAGKKFYILKSLKWVKNAAIMRM